MGNICRSPSAEGVFRHFIQEADLAEQIEIDSAGTIDFHTGKSPDRRAQYAAQQRGFDLSTIRARQVNKNDFYQFDYLLAMDEHNLIELEKITPPDGVANVQLFLDYAQRYSETEVPDPYYGGNEGFEHVLNLIEDAAEGLLLHLKKTHLS